MEATLYNQKGAKSGSIELPKEIFDLKFNADLVHEVVTAMQLNARAGTANTKGRGEVRGGGKKPWKQKGTGRARHSSIRSPIWVGGGITHGPTKDKNYNKKINKQVRTKALFMVLSEKMRSNEILFVDSITLSHQKTKEAASMIHELSKISGFKKMSYKKNAVSLMALPAKDLGLQRSLRNIQSVTIDLAKDLNPVTVLEHKYLIIIDPKESLSTLKARMK